jgi:hypothetical protein
MDRLTKSGFYKKMRDKQAGLSGYTFVPHYYTTEEKAREGAYKFMSVSPSSVLILKKDDKYTFIPLAGDARTLVYRTANAFGAEVVDDIVCLK